MFASRQRALLSGLLLDESRAVLAEKAADEDFVGPRGAFEALERQLDLALAAQMLDAPLPTADGAPQSLLGLSRADAALDPEATAQSAQLYLVPALEDRLRRRCEQAVLLAWPEAADDGQPPLARAHELPGHVAALRAELEAERKRAAAGRRELAALTAQRTAALAETAALLARVAEGHRGALAPELVEARADWSAAFARTLERKLQALTRRVEEDTYRPEAVVALATVHTLVDQRQREAEAELEGALRELRRYEAVGDEFRGIAEEYASLDAQVREKRGFVERLRV